MPESIFAIANRLLEDTTEQWLTEPGQRLRTLVNQNETFGLWAPAEIGRIQTFLTDDLWKEPAYDVTLNKNVLYAPWTIAVGSSVQLVKYGWNGSVRRIDVEDDGSVIALVVLTTRK